MLINLQLRMLSGACSPKLRYVFSVLFFAVLAINSAHAQQYRSKILVTPEGAISSGRELSIEELEAQIGSIDAPYAKSSAGRHLARHYVQQKQYDKAVDYYEQALGAEGLSDVANREMLRELAQVYLLKEDYPAAARTLDRVLAINLVPETADYLLLAQSHYRTKRYADAVAALDSAREAGLSMDRTQMRQAVAIYYRSGAFPQAAQMLQELLRVEPHNPENWHQLVSVYLQQNKRRAALDQLALAREKGIAFDKEDLLLLIDLHAVHKNPYGAAQILEQAMASGELTGNGAHYRKLFELWFLAREKERGQQALAKAARLSGSTELYLYLAQALLEQRDWQALYDTMLAACSKELEDRFVGRANLYLGISQLKLGDEEGARRSFINATLITGAGEKAGEWLDYMEAAPPTRVEALRIVGICYGSEDKRLAPGEDAGRYLADQSTDDSAAQSTSFEIKTVPPMQLFYAQYTMPLAELAPKLRSLAVRLGVVLIKSGGATAGPVHIISEGELSADVDPTWQLALPSKGPARATGKYRLRTAAEFKCAVMRADAAGEELMQEWFKFGRDLQEAGFELTGERRVVVSQSGGLELQLGIL